MTVCGRNSEHIYPPHNKQCPWCAIASTPPASRSGAKAPPPQIALPSPGPPPMTVSSRRPTNSGANPWPTGGPATLPSKPPPTSSIFLAPQVRPRVGRGLRILLRGVGGATALALLWIALRSSADVGEWIRRVSGAYPGFVDMPVFDPPVEILADSNRLVGSGIFAALFSILVFGFVIPLRSNVRAGVLTVCLVASLSVTGFGASRFSREAAQLVSGSMCNGGAGTAGQMGVGERALSFGLTRSCEALAVWRGGDLLRVEPSPTKRPLDVHVHGLTSASGYRYAVASTTAHDPGGRYSVVVFRLDRPVKPARHVVVAPRRSYGYPVFSSHHYIVFLRKSAGRAQVSGLDPLSMKVRWSIHCPKGWQFERLSGAKTSGVGEATLTCSHRHEYREFAVRAGAGRRGAVVESGSWP